MTYFSRFYYRVSKRTRWRLVDALHQGCQKLRLCLQIDQVTIGDGLVYVEGSEVLWE